MAEENIPKQYFHVRDIPTKTVTLYPARAHIVREIPNISLRPGQNEIEVYGFTTAMLDNSLQIEGTGDAASVTITDITVENEANKEKFEDVHDPYEEEPSDVEDYEDSDDESSTVKHAKLKYNDLQTRLKAAEEEDSSAQVQLATLDRYAASVHAGHSDAKNFAESVHNYGEERKRVSAALAKAAKDKTRLQKERDRALWQLNKAQKEEAAKNREAVKAKEKTRRQKARERQERNNEERKRYAELRKHFADRVYRVVVRLETAFDTPGSSRRSSIALASGAAEPSEKALEKSSKTLSNVGLSISYVTTRTYWIPRYDLNISSVQKTARITYRAELHNSTCETWKDARIVLSTSQTSYSGLDDKVPLMEAWQVTLNRYASDNALMSNAEISHIESRKEIVLQSHGHPMHRKKMMMMSSAKPMAKSLTADLTVDRNAGGGSEESYSASAQRQSNHPSGAVDALREENVRADRSVSNARMSRRGGGLLGSFRGQPRGAPTGAEPDVPFNDEVATLNEQLEGGAVDFEESAWEDYGLTATYELPGRRTLAPSSLARRHKIAVLNATNLILNHIAVPKLKAAAFLRAKVKNPSSSVTLLAGQAGITLDGTFLGNLQLQRVSPNQVFNVPLGVDPAIHVSYPKPTLHRSTQGIFNKERTHVFSRSIAISNTKTVPIDLLILDQVPISQDERLRIDVSHPRGLSKEGDSVRCGEPVNDNKKPWGTATATYKKNGEVAWTAQIEKGQACMLKFEYEAKMPSSEAMANA